MLADNIRFLRKKNGLTQEDIARELGYKSFTTIQKWETGVAEPPLKVLKRLADVFMVDMNDLANVDLTKPEPRKGKGIKIPVLGYVAAGLPIAMVEDVIDFEEIPEKIARKGEHFALRIKGDSMEPRICDGDVVIVRQQSDAESGQTVIVAVNGEDATCKRLQKYPESIALVSNNPAYPPKVFTLKEVEAIPITIIGLVVELRAKF